MSVTPVAVLPQKSQELLRESMIHAGLERWGFENLVLPSFVQMTPIGQRSVIAGSLLSSRLFHTVPKATAAGTVEDGRNQADCSQKRKTAPVPLCPTRRISLPCS